FPRKSLESIGKCIFGGSPCENACCRGGPCSLSSGCPHLIAVRQAPTQAALPIARAEESPKGKPVQGPRHTANARTKGNSPSRQGTPPWAPGPASPGRP